jgi:hypothetical protein
MRILLLILTTIIIYGCTSDDDCVSGVNELSHLEDMGCANAVSNIQVMTTNEFELIRSQIEYESMVSARCDVLVDWEKYDLIIGTKPLARGLARLDRSISINCIRGQANLTFSIFLNATTVAQVITFDALIPKLMDSQDLFVDVEIME